MAGQDQERVAEYVRARRGDLGWTQQQLAEKSGVDTGTISSLERAGRWPWARNRAAIEKALGWLPGSLSAIAKGGEPGRAMGGEPERRYSDPNLQAIWELNLPENVRLGMIALARGMQQEAEDRGNGTGNHRSA